MPSTTAPSVKKHELVSFGLVESASVNSISDFTQHQINEVDIALEKKNDDFAHMFICHLIFYAFFCVSLVLHIIIDLGLGSFIKNTIINLTGIGKKVFTEKSPAFA